MSIITLLLWLISIFPAGFGMAIFPIMSLAPTDETTSTLPSGNGDQPKATNITTEDTPKQQTTITLPSGELYVNPSSSAFLAAKNETDPNVLGKLRTLSNTPTGIWLTKHSDISAFRSMMIDAKTKGLTPIVVLYNIPKIGCGSSGAANANEYINWINQVSAALDNVRAIVIIEPDATAMFYCLSDLEQKERAQSLTYAVETFANSGQTPYLDAGHSNWTSVDSMVKNLLISGLAKARGISVNVSNFQTNEDSKAYAEALLTKSSIGGLGVIIDTSRNGNGPPTDMQWCNAPGAKTGISSRLIKDGVVDGYLWVKVPGESDGTGVHCSNSPVAEGAFWLEYALALID